MLQPLLHDVPSRTVLLRQYNSVCGAACLTYSYRLPYMQAWLKI